MKRCPWRFLCGFPCSPVAGSPRGHSGARQPADAARYRIVVLPRLPRGARQLQGARRDAGQRGPRAARHDRPPRRRGAGPHRLVACWDEDWRPAFRVAAIPSYKAHRVLNAARNIEETPAALDAQLPMIVEALELLGIARVGAAGFEADDVIGTLATVEADRAAGHRGRRRRHRRPRPVPARRRRRDDPRALRGPRRPQPRGDRRGAAPGEVRRRDRRRVRRPGGPARRPERRPARRRRRSARRPRPGCSRASARWTALIEAAADPAAGPAPPASARKLVDAARLPGARRRPSSASRATPR